MKKLDEAAVDACGRWGDEDKRKIRVLLFELKQLGWGVYREHYILKNEDGELRECFLIDGGIRYDS